MKKASMLLLSIVFFLFIQTTASAETIFRSTVDDLIGTKYRYGGSTTKGFDCSGFTSYIFAKFDITLPRQSKYQAKVGIWVDKSELRTGDLLFFNTSGSSISHVGIYLNDGQFIHSASKIGVTITNLSDKYYAKRYVSARRMISDELYQQWITDSDLVVNALDTANGNPEEHNSEEQDDTEPGPVGGTI